MIKKRVALLFIFALLCAACSADGQSTIYWSDGDSGRFEGEKFRLHGVDAPETGGVGAYGGAKCEKERELGFDVKAEVVGFTRGRTIVVARRYGPDRHGREVVDLSVDGKDLADTLVSRGWLKPWDYDGGDLKPLWCQN